MEGKIRKFINSLDNTMFDRLRGSKDNAECRRYLRTHLQKFCSDNNVETTKNEKVLLGAFKDTIWMAIRYAHGRHTYAPGLVRSSIKSVKEIYPDFKLKEDKTIEYPSKEELEKYHNQSDDYLNDLFDETS